VSDFLAATDTDLTKGNSITAGQRLAVSILEVSDSLTSSM